MVIGIKYVSNVNMWSKLKSIVLHELSGKIKLLKAVHNKEPAQIKVQHISNTNHSLHKRFFFHLKGKLSYCLAQKLSTT